MVDTVTKSFHMGREDDFTGTINLDSVLALDVTKSGSFDLRGVAASSLGKLLSAMPMPALVVNRSHKIVFANPPWGRTRSDRDALYAKPLAHVISRSDRATRIHGLVEKAFSSRTTQITEEMLNVGENKVWGRVHLRSLRMAHERFVLVLVEDLTLERKQLQLTKKHQEELTAARNSLERRVATRTAELLKTNQRLKEEIEHRKRTEDRLRQNEELYRTLVEDSSDGIFMCRGEYILFANSRLHEMLGMEENGVRGRKLKEIFTPPVREEVGAWAELAMKEGGPPSECQTLLQREDGSQLDVEMSARVVWFGGRPALRVCVTDITDRKRAEELLVRSERLKAVGDLAGGVAHNFNNLLQVITFAAQLGITHIESGNSEQAVEHLKRILESCRMGAETVRRLQEFAQVRHYRENIREGVFDLSKAVSAAVDMTKPWWKTNPEKEGVFVRLEADLSTSCPVRGREGEMFEVAVNLIKNAAEALPDGGNIDVRTFVRDDKVFLEVEDNGCGIDEEQLPRVFEPFATTKGGHGAGLGLSSSLGIVKRHGGDIFVESGEGKGAKVTVTLPRARDVAEEEASSSISHVPAEATFLVVDDSEDGARMLSEGLERLGHKVLTAFSGREAVEVFQENQVDIVICDLGMPEMNGWQVGSAIKKICEERGEPKTPFVLLTGWAEQSGGTEQTEKYGIDRVAEKPLSLDELIHVVGELLSERTRA